jgi:hypothetical protein
MKYFLNYRQRAEIRKKWILEHRTLIKILNNRGPKLGPCGNPVSMGKGKEDFIKV